MRQYGVTKLRAVGPERSTLAVTIPADLGRALVEEGYYFVSIYVTDEGILLKPHRERPAQDPRVADLPEWE